LLNQAGGCDPCELPQRGTTSKPGVQRSETPGSRECNGIAPRGRDKRAGLDLMSNVEHEFGFIGPSICLAPLGRPQLAAIHQGFRGYAATPLAYLSCPVGANSCPAVTQLVIGHLPRGSSARLGSSVLMLRHRVLATTSAGPLSGHSVHGAVMGQFVHAGRAFAD
jgi:hypothetical protein